MHAHFGRRFVVVAAWAAAIWVLPAMAADSQPATRATGITTLPTGPASRPDRSATRPRRSGTSRPSREAGATTQPTSLPGKPLVTRSWNLCDIKPELDGQWQGIRAASDGNCYFASSSHSNRQGAIFCRFDPRTEKITVLTDDITKVCGDDPLKDPPHGKIHSDAVEMDGWIYFGTHGAYFNRGWKGSHLIGCQMKTGEFRDFGIIHPGYSNYSGVAADPKNKRVFVYLVNPPDQENGDPVFLYMVDVVTGDKRNVATLPPGGWNAAVYYMYADDDGNCWLPLPNGVLGKYDAAQDKFVTFADALPNNDRMRFNQWEWTQPVRGENKALVTTHGGRKLYLFDPKAEKDRFRFIADVGGTHLSVSLAGNRVYFIVGKEDQERLNSVNWRAEKPQVVDHGRITDQDGRSPMRIPSLAADAEGRIYMTGDWYAKEGDTQTLRLAQDRNTHEEIYRTENRCERFAYVKLPAGELK
jgi:hypothetical protein